MIMRTGPTKQGTREIIVDLDKHGKESRKSVWRDLAERVAKPSRLRASVNIYKLSKLAKANPGKILVVPGKVLAKGIADTKIDVACLACSAQARVEIAKAKGKVMSLKELIASKTGADKLVITA